MTYMTLRKRLLEISAAGTLYARNASVLFMRRKSFLTAPHAALSTIPRFVQTCSAKISLSSNSPATKNKSAETINFAVSMMSHSNFTAKLTISTYALSALPSILDIVSSNRIRTSLLQKRSYQFKFHGLTRTGKHLKGTSQTTVMLNSSFYVVIKILLMILTAYSLLSRIDLSMSTIAPKKTSPNFYKSK